MTNEDSRLFETDEIIKQNNKAYLKGEGFITAQEGVFSPSTAKPEGGWGVPGLKEVKGGRTKEEEWETLGSAHLESDLIMDKNTKAIFRRISSVIKSKEESIRTSITKVSSKLDSIEKNIADLNKARFSNSVNLLAESLDSLTERVDTLDETTKEKLDEVSLEASSAHDKELILRRESFEQLELLETTISEVIENSSALKESVECLTQALKLQNDSFNHLKNSHAKQIESIRESLEATKRQTAVSPGFEHFKIMSNHRINNLEETIKKLQDQISTLQKELKVREEAPSSNLFLGITIIILALFVAVLWVSNSANTPTETTSTNLENTSFTQNAVTTNQIYPTIGTLNLPINFKGDIVWRSSYFSGGNDVRSVFSYKPTNKTSLNKRQAQTSQKEIMKYVCSTPATQEFLYKNLRFDCVIENWRNEAIHQFYVTKESCR